MYYFMQMETLLATAFVYKTAYKVTNRTFALSCFMRAAALCDDMGMDKTRGNLISKYVI